MHTTLAALVLLSGCCPSETRTYVAYNDYGGELSISLVGTIGIDVTVAGMTDEELEDTFGGNTFSGCAPPRLTRVSDNGFPGSIVACVPEVTVTSTSGCAANAEFRLYLDNEGVAAISLDPVPAAPDGTVSCYETDDGSCDDGYLDVGSEGLAASGEYSTVVKLIYGCLDEPEEHALTVVWDFPLHDEREVEEVTPGDCQSGGGGWGWGW